MTAALHVSQAVIKRIGDIGMLRKPMEAAGFVFPGECIIELANRSLAPNTTFEFDPEDVILALEAAHLNPSDRDWEEAVFWHTHPGGLIGPSTTDIEQKLDPEITHLVVSLTDEGYFPIEY